MIYQIIALLIWSSAFVAAKQAYLMFDPFLTIQLRLIIAGLIMLPMAIKTFKTLPKSEYQNLLWLTFFNYVIVLLLQFVGLQYTSSSSAVTIIGLEPLMVVFIGHFFFKDPAQPYHWLCGALAFLGVGLLIAGGQSEGDISLLGCFLVFLGGLGFSWAIRPTQQFLKRVPTATYTSLSMVLAPFMCLPFTLLFAHNPNIQFNEKALFGLLYLGVGCSWLAYFIWNKGMNTVSANLSGLLTALEPLFGVLLAIIILKEKISALSWIGIFIIMLSTITATIIPNLKKHKKI